MTPPTSACALPVSGMYPRATIALPFAVALPRPEGDAATEITVSVGVAEDTPDALGSRDGVRELETHALTLLDREDVSENDAHAETLVEMDGEPLADAEPAERDDGEREREAAAVMRVRVGESVGEREVE